MKSARRELQAALTASIFPLSLCGSQVAAPPSSNEVSWEKDRSMDQRTPQGQAEVKAATHCSYNTQCQRDPACIRHFTLSKTQVSMRGTGMAVG